MVSIYTAYAMINQAVLASVDSLVFLQPVEEEKVIRNYVRLEESPNTITERKTRLEKTVVIAHKLEQYTNKFYSISLEEDDFVYLDILLDASKEQIDLTEFGEFV